MFLWEVIRMTIPKFQFTDPHTIINSKLSMKEKKMNLQILYRMLVDQIALLDEETQIKKMNSIKQEIDIIENEIVHLQIEIKEFDKNIKQELKKHSWSHDMNVVLLFILFFILLLIFESYWFAAIVMVGNIFLCYHLFRKYQIQKEKDRQIQSENHFTRKQVTVREKKVEELRKQQSSQLVQMNDIQDTLDSIEKWRNYLNIISLYLNELNLVMNS